MTNIIRCKKELEIDIYQSYFGIFKENFLEVIVEVRPLTVKGVR